MAATCFRALLKQKFQFVLPDDLHGLVLDYAGILCKREISTVLNNISFGTEEILVKFNPCQDCFKRKVILQLCGSLVLISQSEECLSTEVTITAKLGPGVFTLETQILANYSQHCSISGSALLDDNQQDFPMVLSVFSRELPIFAVSCHVTLLTLGQPALTDG
jgi:hypothetical protein